MSLSGDGDDIVDDEGHGLTGEELALLTAVHIRVKFCLEMGDENWRRGRRARIAGNIESSI